MFESMQRKRGHDGSLTKDEREYWISSWQRRLPSLETGGMSPIQQQGDGRAEAADHPRVSYDLEAMLNSVGSNTSVSERGLSSPLQMSEVRGKAADQTKQLRAVQEKMEDCATAMLLKEEAHTPPITNMKTVQRQVYKKTNGKARGLEWATSKDAVTHVATSKDIENGIISSASYGSCVGVLLWNEEKKTGLIAHFWAGKLKNLETETKADAKELKEIFTTDFGIGYTKAWIWPGNVDENERAYLDSTKPRIGYLKEVFSDATILKARSSMTFDSNTGTF